MSDAIEKLLAQVSQGTASAPATSGTVAAKGGSAPAKRDSDKRDSDKPGGRLAFAVIAAAIFGGMAFVVGWLLTPFVLTGTSMGLGAALGAFATGIIAGPPRWFSS